MIGPRPGSVPEKKVPKISTVCDIKYHFVWIVKYKYKFFFRPEAIFFYKQYVHRECEANGIKILSGLAHRHYVDITLQCPPSISPAEIVEILRDHAPEVLQKQEERFREVYDEFKKDCNGQPVADKAF